MQLGTRIYDKDTGGYFYYSTEEYTKDGLLFNKAMGCYEQKDEEGNIIAIYSRIINDELVPDDVIAEEEVDFGGYFDIFMGAWCCIIRI